MESEYFEHSKPTLQITYCQTGIWPPYALNRKLGFCCDLVVKYAVFFPTHIINRVGLVTTGTKTTSECNLAQLHVSVSASDWDNNPRASLDHVRRPSGCKTAPRRILSPGGLQGCGQSDPSPHRDFRSSLWIELPFSNI